LISSAASAASTCFFVASSSASLASFSFFAVRVFAYYFFTQLIHQITKEKIKIEIY
jgi:hypothetical protein